jgi:hypothetical protein
MNSEGRTRATGESDAARVTRRRRLRFTQGLAVAGRQLRSRPSGRHMSPKSTTPQKLPSLVRRFAGCRSPCSHRAGPVQSGAANASSQTSRAASGSGINPRSVVSFRNVRSLRLYRPAGHLGCTGQQARRQARADAELPGTPPRYRLPRHRESRGRGQQAHRRPR